ncbi:MAG: DNA primase [Chthoniobacter sp.]|uniref:DNA primase n=1 Tax=Chthoniobacter sp. TaxID=2510640 RepID=UPI0032A9D526
MSLIPPEIIEQIIAANDIVEVIGAYFPLKRSGPVYKALCPFHQERTPSFSVNPQRQIFKCFGCGAGGSVIRFVMNYENLDFVAAAKKLAERAGIEIVQAELSAEDEARYSMSRRLKALHAEATEFFHWHLMKKPSAQIARDYLKSRGVGGEIAKSWKLGYAPDEWDAMRDFAQTNHFSEEELVASGLVKLRDEENPHGEFYDRFRARVMFPIYKEDDVIAFSGRVLEADAKAAKYVNSPETMLFTKGAVLFGLNKSKRALIEAKSAIVCEGQLDLITAFENGVQNVIAPQGTAFTDKQARILKRFVDEVVLCFDADIAGEKAAERSLASLLAENLMVRVAEMPQGEDPDSMIRGKGAEAFRERITAAKDFFDFQIDRLASKPEFATPRGKMQAARKTAESISLIRDAVLRETVMHRVTQRLEVSAQEFVKLLKAPTTKALEETASSETGPEPIVLDERLRLLTLLALKDAGAREWLLAEAWDTMLQDQPDAELLVKILGSDIRPDDDTSIHVFLSTLNAAEESVISGVLGEPLPPQPMLTVHDCWRDLECRRVRRRMETIQARVRTPDLALEEVAKMQKEIIDLQKRLSDISRPLSPPL